LKLFELPRPVGEYEGEEVVAAVGRFGPYVRHGKAFVSLKKDDNPYTVTIERAIELIEEKRKKESEKFIKTFEKEDIQVLNGRFGPYIAHAGANFRIPKGKDPAALSLDDCRTIIAAQSKDKDTAAKPKAKAKATTRAQSKKKG